MVSTMKKTTPDERGYPRQVRMTDEFHAAAVKAAAADGKDFSGYVRDLIAADLKRRERTAKR